jgi:hypothetical protein
MRIKLSTLVLASAAMAAVALTAIPAMASVTVTATVKVPFSFTVDGKQCPAGIYLVQRDTPGNFVRLQSKDASQNFGWIAGSSDAKDGSRVVLSFDQLGQTHILRSIQYGPLATPRLDKKLMKGEDISPQDIPGQ